MWSSCRGMVAVFTKKTTMTNDDRGHRSSFGCHITDSGHMVLVATTVGWWWCCGVVVVWGVVIVWLGCIVERRTMSSFVV